jgi:Tfp pilus assembly protein PilF
LSGSKTFAKNLGKRIGWVVTGHQKAGEALAGVSKDAAKLKRAAQEAARSNHHKEAARLTELGREAYNLRNYVAAEDYFRQAIAADRRFALAHTYLGHALYKQGKLTEAMSCWHRAIQADPNSEAAGKARSKLLYVEKKQLSASHELMDRPQREV